MGPLRCPNPHSVPSSASGVPSQDQARDKESPVTPLGDGADGKKPSWRGKWQGVVALLQQWGKNVVNVPTFGDSLTASVDS